MFGRVARLQIQPPSGSGVEIDGLRVRFRVHRIPGKQDAATVDVWGLGIDTYQQIGDYRTVTRIVAGYEDGPLGDVCQGQTVRDSVRRQITDGEVVTTWQVQESATYFQDVRLSAAWSGSVTSDELLSYVARQVGATPAYQAAPRTVTYARGYALPSDWRAALTSLARDAGASWSIANGRLVLVPLDGSAARVRAVVLAPDSGLLGWPQQSDGGNVLARSLLQPGLLPGDAVRIDGDTLPGDYVVQELQHDGASWGDDWSTTIKAKARR